jgi:transposase
VGLSQRTIFRLEKRFVTQGIEATLHDKPRSGAPKKIAGDVKALVVATACSKAPEGHDHWSLRMLSARMVELEVVEQFSHESIRAILKKTS